MATKDADTESKSLKDLLVRRSSIKGQITKSKNYLDKLSKNESLKKIELTELNVKLAKLYDLSARFDELQSQIEVINSANLQNELDEREKIEDELSLTIATGKDLYNQYSNKDSPQCTSDPQDSGIKLPKIQIAKFDGSYFHWLEFRDTFKSLIDSSKQLTSIHKFHYLISYLEGDAARIISNLEVSSKNYKEAWRLLCDRYDNKRLLINHHLKSLFNIHPFAKESEKSLRFLVDHVTKNLRALSSLGQPTDHWDTLIIFNLSAKLDNGTLAKWEEFRNDVEDVPTLDSFKKFLIDRADVLQSLNRNKQDNYYNKNNQSQQNNQQKNHTNKHEKNNYVKSFVTTNKNKGENSSFLCIICEQNHKIYTCPTFKSKPIEQKLADVAKYKLCSNCLRQGHPTNDCRFGPCRECKQRHNSLLHQSPTQPNSNISVNQSQVVNSDFSNHNVVDVLLSTALIEVRNPITGQSETARALLDSGSQSTFITRELKQKLCLNSNRISSLKIVGIGNQNSTEVVESCTAELNSKVKKFSVTLNLLVLNDLTGQLPKNNIDIRHLNIPKNIQLADPSFNQPSKIDILIGADLFWDLLNSEQMSLGPNNPKLQYSQFGWLISGPVGTSFSTTIRCNHAITKNSCNMNFDEERVDTMLTKFWDIEEIPSKPILSERDRACEKHFLQNTKRDNNGRFVVTLPLSKPSDSLGESYNIAKKRFFNLERRFRKNPTLKNQYVIFLKEYQLLGHMSEAPVEKPDPAYFLCHHAVFKNESESTKIRVVFDGSVPTSSGLSVNDILMLGPNIQNSLFSILIRARQYKYLLTGDIEKMYRQVNVAETSRNLQLIVWREDESLPIKTYQLNTLTYGTTSASYLSTRCLWQAGEECGDESVKIIIQNDFYVDDLITGTNDQNSLRNLQKSISTALNKACFNLRKYKSNLPDLFQNSEINTQDNLTLSEASSTLGLGWDPKTDKLNFPTQRLSESDVITKRYILSNSFKIFDPLGLLSPCIIRAKIILQDLWLQKMDWDQPVSQDIKEQWNEFSINLNFLSKLHIPRKVLCDTPQTIEIHAFSDASQRAYGACVYMRSTCGDDVMTRLLCAKSKVARINPMTIPRLELCAALLAANLCKSVIDSLRYKADRVVYWCDSSVVLGWLKSDPTKLKTFVANRVVEINEMTDISCWRYVPTSENPADFISRGINASQILGLDLWWHGPKFLSESEVRWPLLNPEINELPESKNTNKTLIKTKNLPLNKISLGINSAPKIQKPEKINKLKNNKEININVKINSSEQLINIQNYSSLNKLIRILAFTKRFIFNSRNPNAKRAGILTVSELNDAFHSLCIIAQIQSFPNEYKALSSNLPLHSKSNILSLSPFLDNNKLIRVGGRINSSKYNYEKRHPILLDSSHHLTKLLFEREHINNMHAGPQLLLSLIRESVWPVNGRRLARRTAHNCVLCRRMRGQTLCPKMGDLPSQRITADFPFKSVGIDFAGPFITLNRKGRGAKTQKSYLCLFICLRFKCVHLEAVSDLTKDAFIMTLRRFVARRGRPIEIFSDNGRNFVAAAKDIGNFIKQNSDSILDFAIQENINFIFTPTYAPHFGGIWEAGVKSAKYHIKRVMGNTHLTFEEISTLFTQVEAILNSRPLCPLSSSPDDYLPLSPGHFLIGRPLRALPAPNLEDHKEGHLQRYARLEQIHQHFWSRWQREYIHELQQRVKWKTNKTSLKIGDLVLLQEDHVPPLCWRLGRVERLFPGPDGISRVADVKTTRGCFRRPLVRLCPLPTDDELQG